MKLLHGSLTYRDERLAGFDAAAVVEVVEHLDPPRRAAFERVVFEFARPDTVVLTTPNREHNAAWATLPAGSPSSRWTIPLPIAARRSCACASDLRMRLKKR